MRLKRQPFSLPNRHNADAIAGASIAFQASPQNPTGVVDQQEKLGKIARAKNFCARAIGKTGGASQISPQSMSYSPVEGSQGVSNYSNFPPVTSLEYQSQAHGWQDASHRSNPERGPGSQPSSQPTRPPTTPSPAATAMPSPQGPPRPAHNKALPPKPELYELETSEPRGRISEGATTPGPSFRERVGVSRKPVTPAAASRIVGSVPEHVSSTPAEGRPTTDGHESPCKENDVGRDEEQHDRPFSGGQGSSLDRLERHNHTPPPDNTNSQSGVADPGQTGSDQEDTTEEEDVDGRDAGETKDQDGASNEEVSHVNDSLDMASRQMTPVNANEADHAPGTTDETNESMSSTTDETPSPAPEKTNNEDHQALSISDKENRQARPSAAPPTLPNDNDNVKAILDNANLSNSSASSTTPFPRSGPQEALGASSYTTLREPTHTPIPHAQVMTPAAESPLDARLRKFLRGQGIEESDDGVDLLSTLIFWVRDINRRLTESETRNQEIRRKYRSCKEKFDELERSIEHLSEDLKAREADAREKEKRLMSLQDELLSARGEAEKVRTNLEEEKLQLKNSKEDSTKISAKLTEVESKLETANAKFEEARSSASAWEKKTQYYASEHAVALGEKKLLEDLHQKQKHEMQQERQNHQVLITAEKEASRVAMETQKENERTNLDAVNQEMEKEKKRFESLLGEEKERSRVSMEKQMKSEEEKRNRLQAEWEAAWAAEQERIEEERKGAKETEAKLERKIVATKEACDREVASHKQAADAIIQSVRSEADRNQRELTRQIQEESKQAKENEAKLEQKFAATKAAYDRRLASDRQAADVRVQNFQSEADRKQQDLTRQIQEEKKQGARTAETLREQMAGLRKKSEREKAELRQQGETEKKAITEKMEREQQDIRAQANASLEGQRRKARADVRQRQEAHDRQVATYLHQIEGLKSEARDTSLDYERKLTTIEEDTRAESKRTIEGLQKELAICEGRIESVKQKVLQHSLVKYEPRPDSYFNKRFQTLSQKVINLAASIDRPQNVAALGSFEQSFLLRNTDRRDWPKLVRHTVWTVVIWGFYSPCGFGSFGAENLAMFQIFRLFSSSDESEPEKELPNDAESNMGRSWFFKAILGDIEKTHPKDTRFDFPRQFWTNIDKVHQTLQSKLKQLSGRGLGQTAQSQTRDLLRDFATLSLEMATQRSIWELQSCEHGTTVDFRKFKDSENPRATTFTVDLMTQPALVRKGDGQLELTSEMTLSAGEIVALKRMQPPRY